MKLKAKWLLGSLVVLMLMFAAGCGGGGTTPAPAEGEAGEQQVEIVLSHTAAPGTPIFLTYEKFKEEVEARSNGSVTVRVHHSATLAGDTQGIEMLKNNTLGIASAPTNNMAPFTDVLTI